MDTPIKASNDGIVAFAGDLFYAGKCIIINHGNYIFTIYAHLNKINVKTNDKIKRSQIIALSGKSGRVTGAHLHFGTIINGIKVNPKSFINVINGIIEL
jgi:murein DD-endopeptidase MepM/ murein hydrolase activator NlpD